MELTGWRQPHDLWCAALQSSAKHNRTRRQDNPRVTRSKIAQRQEPADEHRRNGARHQHESALDEIANRLAEPPLQSGKQEESEAARDQRGESEGGEVEFRDPASLSSRA